MNKQGWFNVAYFNISEFAQSNNFGFDVSSPENFFLLSETVNRILKPLLIG